ncbi:hypothetical protein CLOP_g14986 [Closterium sp. NIES-67]|nr:hypothetical protein CLOP_g14986 [Closterium sp. NIES-67]
MRALQQTMQGRHMIVQGRRNGRQRPLCLLLHLLLIAAWSAAVASAAVAAAGAGSHKEEAAETSASGAPGGSGASVQASASPASGAAVSKGSSLKSPDIALFNKSARLSGSSIRDHHTGAGHFSITKGNHHTGAGKLKQRPRRLPWGLASQIGSLRKWPRGSSQCTCSTSSSQPLLRWLRPHKTRRGEEGCGKGRRGKGKRSKGKRSKGKRSKVKRSKGKRSKGKRSKGKRSRSKRGKVVTGLLKAKKRLCTAVGCANDESRRREESRGRRVSRASGRPKSPAETPLKPPAQMTPGQKPPAPRTPGQKPPPSKTPGQKPPAPMMPGQKPPASKAPGQKAPAPVTPGSRSPASPGSSGAPAGRHVSMKSQQGSLQTPASGDSSMEPSAGAAGSAGFPSTAAASPSPPPAAAQQPKPKYFYEMGKIRVSGIHTALTHYKTILYIDRTDVSNTYAKLPNGRTAYAEEYSFESRSLRALDVKSNVFCSAGAIDQYGRLISIGGTSDANATNLADPLLDGAASIRSFTPCPPAAAAAAANTAAKNSSSSNNSCDFSLVGKMTSKRWYPTAQLLPDGRIFVIGGANVFGNVAINSFRDNNPTYEFWPRKEAEGNYKLRFLEETLPYNLYPFVHLLPSGHLFIFAGQQAILLNYTTNSVYRTLPPLDVSRFGPTNANIFRSYPVTGSSAMLQLSSADGYTPRILICGGSSSKADLANRDNRTGACLGCAAPATATCGLIAPMDRNPKWTYEIMPVARVMPDAVLLLDGTVLICNGGRRGFQGLKQTYAGGDVRSPVIYSPNSRAGSRFWQVPESSRYARMYHSSALLLWDGSVLISGSNPNDRLTTRGTYPTQFAVDRFAPPYLQWGVPRNILWRLPSTIALNSLFSVRLNTTVVSPPSLSRLIDRFRAVLVHPGFSTHSQRMGMRNVLLEISAIWISPDNQTVTASIRAPPNGSIAPPSIYWLHILDQGGYRNADGAWVPGKWVPSLEGQPIRLT